MNAPPPPNADRSNIDRPNAAARPPRSLMPTALAYAFAVALLLWLLRGAPFYGPAYCFWIGGVVFLAGLVSFVRPLRILLIDRRRGAAWVAGAGLLFAATGLFWPAPVRHAPGASRLATLLPDYTFGEYHEVRVPGTPEQVLQLTREVDFEDVPTIRFLLQVRQLAGRALGEKHSPLGKKSAPDDPFKWDVIDAGPHERLLCLFLRVAAPTAPPPVTSADQFLAFHDPGCVKVVANLRVEDLGNGYTRLSSETRVQPTDETAHRHFKRYWRIIYPGTALTRRALLDTIAARAANHPPR